MMEGLRLRVKDLDFGQNQIIVRDGKGGKDRVTMLPSLLREELQRHLGKVKDLHRQDLAEGFGKVRLPGALASKYRSAAGEWVWQYVYPAPSRSRDPRTGDWGRHDDDLHARLESGRAGSPESSGPAGLRQSIRPPRLPERIAEAVCWPWDRRPAPESMAFIWQFAEPITFQEPGRVLFSSL